MKCPLLRTPLDIDGKIFPLVPADCLQEECAWWEKRFGKCCIAVPAYLTGVEDARKEAKANYDNR